MEKWQVVLGTMLALVVTALVPLTALAQSGDEATAARKPQFKGALAIVAPRGVPVGKEMSLGVFLRENQEPVPGAGVWALTKDSAEEIRKEADVLREKVASAEDADYEALLGNRGHFLGRTREDGRLFHAFKEAGNYVLIAAKKGYIPDFTSLVVRGVNANALVVSAPRVSPPGESVTITVTERGSGEPVKEAGVWALTREKAEELKGQIGNARTADNTTDVEALLNSRGIFLGTTHGNGELKYTFEKESIYVLVAFKRGYMPGFTGIAIKNAPKALTIQAPRTSPVGESVTITVTERGSGEPVKEAGVWALTPPEAEALRSRLAETKPADNATAAVDAESVLNGRGIFLGRTNDNGEVKHTFKEAGRYILVTAKKGYIPGFTGIAIAAPKSTTKATDKPALTPRAIERPKPRNVPSNNSTNSNSTKQPTTF